MIAKRLLFNWEFNDREHELTFKNYVYRLTYVLSNIIYSSIVNSCETFVLVKRSWLGK